MVRPDLFLDNTARRAVVLIAAAVVLVGGGLSVEQRREPITAAVDAAPPVSDEVAAGPATDLSNQAPDPPSPTTTGPGSGSATSAPTSSTLPIGQPAADHRSWLHEVGTPGRTFLGVSTATDSSEELRSFSEAAGRIPDVVMISRDWASGSFDRDTVERLTNDGHLPMIAWEPWDHALALAGNRLRSVQPAYTLGSIISGAHDESLREWASGAADWGQPVALRFAHEMNGFWYPWAESANGNRPGEFVEAWRHVHDIFEAEGATNVIWVWSPNLDQSTLTPLAELWPGDEYVDWVGLVGYLGNGIDPSRWTPTFDELFGPTLDIVASLTDRPIVITEIGATEDGGKKAEWIEEVLATVAANPRIVGLMWFEIDKEADWRIVSSEAATLAFANGISDDAVWGIPRQGRSTRELAEELGVS